MVKRLAVLLIFAGFGWYLYGDSFEEAGIRGVYHDIREDLQNLGEHPAVRNTIDWVQQEVQFLSDRMTETRESTEVSAPAFDTPKLEAPSRHAFSVHSIELGDSRAEAEEQLGTPKRETRNEYGVNWVAYHEDYQNFVMVSYNEDAEVNGLYTNQDLLASKEGISFDSSRDEVLEIMPDPLRSLRKGLVNYQIQSNGEYDLFETDDSYITIFYDLHREEKVNAVLIIDHELEQQKSRYFGEPSEKLREGFEYQLFDLTNAARVFHGLSPLTWEESALDTVRSHSKDMAVNNYFSHTNLDGQSPFDRLSEDAVSYRIAGENLAAGQPSSIFAHEGLMNSLGHRENKLRSDYQSLSVGVAFNDDHQPFYTENYLSN